MLIAAGALNRALKKIVSIVPKRSTLPVVGLIAHVRVLVAELAATKKQLATNSSNR